MNRLSQRALSEIMSERDSLVVVVEIPQEKCVLVLEWHDEQIRSRFIVDLFQADGSSAKTSQLLE